MEECEAMIKQIMQIAARPRWRTSVRIVAFAALVIAAPKVVLADDLPSGEQVIEDYIKATGGRAAYEKHHSLVMNGTMEIAAMGLKGSLTVYSAAPNKTRVILEFEGMGKTEEGFDGTTVWSSSPFEGPRVLEGEERDFKSRLNTFNSEIHWKELYPKVECVGTEDIGGKTCYKVVLTPATGKPMTNYYDKESKLVVRTDMILKTSMGEIAVESTPEDYREAGGVLFAHKTTESVMGMQHVMTISKIEFNTDLPADIFELPAEIKALVAKKAESGKATADDTP